jgi:hypothetical protein
MAEATLLPEFRVLVTGGRGYPDSQAVFLRLASCRQEAERNGLKLTVIHGDCPTGADHWADLWCRREGVDPRRYPAPWKLQGRSAGPRRNQRMLDAEQPDLVLAFPGNRGTADLVRRACAAGMLIAPFDSDLAPHLSRALQGALAADRIASRVLRRTCGDGEDVMDSFDLGR